MEQREGSVVGNRKHEPAAVRRSLRVANGGVVRPPAPDRVHLLADDSRLRIEIRPDEVVFGLHEAVGQGYSVCYAIKDGASVGREAWEGLPGIGPGYVRDIDHPVVLEIGDRQVGSRVKDLHPRDGLRMEAGQDDIGREDAEPAAGVQFPIDRGGEHVVRLEGEFPELSVLVQDAAALGAPDVVQGIIPARLSMEMAVHAGIVRMLPVADRRFVEILDTALQDGHFMVHLVGRLDEPVGQPAVHRVFAHLDGPLVRERLALDDGFRRYGNRLAFSAFQESLPGAEAPLHLVTPDGDRLVAEGERRLCFPDIRHGVPEVERRDVGRDGDVLVIRIDHQGAFAAVHGEGGIPRPAAGQGEEREYRQG